MDSQRPSIVGDLYEFYHITVRQWWMREHEHVLSQTKTKPTKQYKTATAQTHGEQTKRQNKIPRGTHAYTFTFWKRSMVMKAHSTLHTGTLVWWHGKEQSSEANYIKITQDIALLYTPSPHFVIRLRLALKASHSNILITLPRLTG